MKDNTVFWKMHDGKLVSVDEMDTNHVKNAFKHLIKHHQNVVQQANEVVDKYNALVRKRNGSTSFNLNGDIAQSFNHDMENAKLEEEADYDPYNDSIIDGMTDWRETQ